MPRINAHVCQVLCLVLALLISSNVPAVSPPSRRKIKKTRLLPPPAPPQQLQSVLDQARRTAEQAQTEARQAREQNDLLQRQLAENTAEIARLRQTIAEFGTRLEELKNPPAETKQIAAISSAQDKPPIEDVKSDLELLREQVDVHAAQIKEQAQTKVESDSKFRIKLHGLLLFNTFLNTKDSTLNDVPLFAALPNTAYRKNNVGASLRQSRFGFTLEGPTLSPALGSARLTAETEFDFWSGDNTEVLGSLRILTASARLDWERTSLIVGQRPPLISPRNPTSLAAVWFSPFNQAGNLWQWRPQIMVEHRLKAGESSEIKLQGGVLMPFGESVQNVVIEGGPGFESRAVWARPLDNDRSLEFGVGGYFHRRSFALNRNVNSHALTADWQIPLGQRLELSGEVYWGRAVNLGEAAGFRTDRLYATTGSLTSPATQILGVWAAGGWTQLNYKARADLDFNLAYGQEDPRNSDLRFGQIQAATRFKNQAASANFIWSLRQNFLVSLEYRRLWTDYATSRQRAGHYNLAFGYRF